MKRSACPSLLLAWALLAGPACAEDALRATINADGVQHVSILGGSYFFKPKHIVVKANVPVELAVKVEPGMIPHSFVLKAPEAGIDIDTGLSTSPKIFRFTPTAAGRFPFYCSHKLLFFKSHRERGMEGVLEVVNGP